MMIHFLLTICLLLGLVVSTSGKNYTCDSRSSCGCSSRSSTNVGVKIVGGEKAEDRAWNWLVSLEYLGSHICGATLLSANYAVTAGHCVAWVKDLSKLTIVAGTNYLDDETSSTVQRRTVLESHVHPQYSAPYNTSVTNDIAVISFASLSTGANAAVNFICLPTSQQDPYSVGDDVVAIGWGSLTEESNTPSNSLQQVTVQTVASNSTVCKRAQIRDPAVQFCAGVDVGGKDTCQGDSGGPLMSFVGSRWILAGITSYGFGCAKAGYPGLYTRVSTLVPFVQFIMNGGKVATTPTASPTIKSSTSHAHRNYLTFVVYLFNILLLKR